MPFANDQEYRLGVKNTLAFIRAHYTMAAIRRPQVEETAAGGKRKIDPLILPEQMVRVIPMSGLVWDRAKTTPDEGSIPDVTLMMVAHPDVDVQKNDYFPYANGWVKVHHVSPVKGYRREARLQFTNTEPRS